MDSVTTGHISRPFSSLLVISHHLIHICIHYPSASLSLKLQPKTKLCPFCIGPIIILNRAYGECSFSLFSQKLIFIFSASTRGEGKMRSRVLKIWWSTLLIWGHYLLNWLRNTFSKLTTFQLVEVRSTDQRWDLPKLCRIWFLRPRTNFREDSATGGDWGIFWECPS